MVAARRADRLLTQASTAGSLRQAEPLSPANQMQTNRTGRGRSTMRKKPRKPARFSESRFRASAPSRTPKPGVTGSSPVAPVGERAANAALSVVAGDAE